MVNVRLDVDAACVLDGADRVSVGNPRANIAIGGVPPQLGRHGTCAPAVHRFDPTCMLTIGWPQGASWNSMAENDGACDEECADFTPSSFPPLHASHVSTACCWLVEYVHDARPCGTAPQGGLCANVVCRIIFLEIGALAVNSPRL